MQNFSVTVKEDIVTKEMEFNIALRSSEIQEEYYFAKARSSYDRPETLYLARVASAVMSRFCATIFPRYEVMIRLGKPMDPYFFYGENMQYELIVRVKGWMDVSEQDRLKEMLNRIVAESQREAMS